MKQDKQTGSEHFAIARAINLPISTKQSVEIANFIRNKPVAKAKNLLNLVLEKKVAVPHKRFKTHVAHRKGRIGPGRYPQKATKAFLKLIDSAQANAENKGLDVNKLIITEVVPTLGTRELHHGRQIRTMMKRTHIKVKVEEK